MSKAGLYRMMMLESGGQRTGRRHVQGPLPVLPATWARQLEPVARTEHLQRLGADPRDAYALGSGMGPSQWPITYPMAF